jgi:predicted AlkP superfamily pyrophosphatase or phosphodiesterase
MGAIIEMNEMREKIYLTYTAYDEVAHQRGPETKEAVKTLKRIDKSLGKLIKNGRKKGYEIFVFSDHGQSSSTPFEKIYGESIEQFINKSIKVKTEKYKREGENSALLVNYFF